jgi:hypothetical protein
MSQARRTALLAAVLLGVERPASLGAANIDSNLAASPAAQAGGGGCYPVPLHPSQTDPINLFNPEWAAVDVGTHTPPLADPITLHGTVALSKINELGDFPGSHSDDDQNTFLIVDPADMFFVATVAGWRRDPTPMTRLRVQVTAIDILNPLKPLHPAVAAKQRCSVTTDRDCSATPCPEGERCLSLGGPVPGWAVYLEVNGTWQKLAGLEAGLAPARVPQALRFDVALPPDGALHLHATGRSLDCRETLYGMSLSRILALYGIADDGPACLLADSHEIGELDLVYPAPDFGSAGHSADYVTQSVGGEGGSCTGAPGQLCLGDADCPAGDTCVVTGGPYRLHYTITRRS